jgi:hypothetical protein
MRQSLGTAVFAGMIGVALFGIFLTPVFYYVLMWFGGHKQAGPGLVPQPAASPGNAGGTSRGPAEEISPPDGRPGGVAITGKGATTTR